jgi:hypothetical protein
MSLLTDFQRARRISTPLIAITTADQEATLRTIVANLDWKTPAVRYDVAQGPQPCRENEPEDQCAAFAMVGEDEQLAQLYAEDTARAMIQAFLLPGECVLFFLNAQRQINEPRVAQAIACMRDRFKTDRRTLVLLTPQITLPEQLAGDVMMLDDPLPGPEEIGQLLDKTYSYFTDPPPAPSEDTRRKAIEAVRGLHTAAIDQAFAFAMEPTGIDIPACWAQKRSRVEQTRGLTFYRGGETYNDIGGLDAFKSFMQEIYAGPEPFRLIVWLDEVEKTFTGSVGYGGDGGVNADQLGTILTNMEDNGWTGAIAIGPPGAGKSFIAKATGNTFELPCIRMDLGAMKGSLVGESEQYVRQAMKVLLAIADQGAFFIATCNSIQSLPPELKRRFSLGRTWFFDLPDEQERESIWKLNLARFGLDPNQPRPDSNEWTGSDIRDCCLSAYRRRRSLTDVSRQIIPFAQTEPQRLFGLRDLADNKFLSASYEGAYRNPAQVVARKPAVTVKRVGGNPTFN